MSKAQLVELAIALRKEDHGNYDPKKFSYLCEQMTLGRSAREICRDDQDKGAPSRSVLYRWLADTELVDRYDLQRKYQFAMVVRAHDMFDEMIEIADDARNDWMERFGKNGQSEGWILNGEHVQRSKLRIDVRKFAVATMAPSVYGNWKRDDKVDDARINATVIELYPEVVAELPQGEVGEDD